MEEEANLQFHHHLEGKYACITKPYLKPLQRPVASNRYPPIKQHSFECKR